MNFNIRVQNIEEENNGGQKLVDFENVFDLPFMSNKYLRQST